MTRRLLVCAMLLALPLAVHGEDKTGKRPAVPANPAFEKMKKLAGTWVQADEHGNPTNEVFSIIKVTAGGSAVHETSFPGTPQEMISLYTVDGADLILTHYCVLGNQPRMKADPKSPANQIVFQFAGGSGFDPARDAHAHSMTITFVDDRHIELEGVAWADGAPSKEMCCGFKLVRKK